MGFWWENPFLVMISMPVPPATVEAANDGFVGKVVWKF